MKALLALTIAAAALTGCADSQERYHASIRKDCQAQGLTPGTQVFQECFAKELHQDHSYSVGSRPWEQSHSWKHDMK
jgi:hypothetical protein